MEITKRFAFSYAHILPHHEGQCRRLHGHNGVIEVTVRSKGIQTSGNTEGMVIDFGALKILVNSLIIDKWDHRFLAKGDEWVVEAARRWDAIKPIDSIEDWTVGYHIAYLGVRTTAEELSRLIFATLAGPVTKLGKGVRLQSVKFYETDTAYAETTAESI